MVKGKKHFVTRTFVEKQFYFSLLQSEKHFLALSQAVNDCPALSCFSLESDSGRPCGLQPPVPLLRAILRAVTLERVACPPPGGFPTQGSNSASPVSCDGRQVLYHQHHL